MFPVVPILPLPKSLPALVEDDCGGGFSICDAVGARDWRIEYVRCILGEVIESSDNIDVCYEDLVSLVSRIEAREQVDVFACSLDGR